MNITLCVFLLEVLRILLNNFEDNIEIQQTVSELYFIKKKISNVHTHVSKVRLTILQNNMKSVSQRNSQKKSIYECGGFILQIKTNPFSNINKSNLKLIKNVAHQILQNNDTQYNESLFNPKANITLFPRKQLRHLRTRRKLTRVATFDIRQHLKTSQVTPNSQ